MTLSRFVLCALMSLLPLTAAVTYTYDDAGRVALVDYGNGATIAYTYDKAGNLLNRTVTTAPPAQSTAPKPQPPSSKNDPADAKKSKARATK